MVHLKKDTEALWKETPKENKRWIRWDTTTKIRITMLILFVIGYSYISFPSLPQDLDYTGEEICPIGETLRPSSFTSDNSSVSSIINDPVIRDLAVKRLSDAVRIPTITRDDILPPDEDPDAWKSFAEFHSFLEDEFSLLYNTLKVEKVETYGLVYTWEGSESDLKPLLLSGHIDVVPVDKDTRDKWTHDPFSGYFDGENIWGRGSSDCKSLVIATLHGIERLIIDGYKPKRTIIVGYGFDEEIGGILGATSISKLLHERYGENSIFALIDEGGSAIATIDGRVFALPSVGEKGSLNLKISLTTPGGHSSIPPDHTNIGIVAKVVNQIESNPFDAILTGTNPTLSFLQCVAKYSNEFDEGLKRNIFRALYDKVANAKVLEFLNTVKAYKYLVRTTQAIDLIQGGVKSNALPEFTELVSNHRVSVESSIEFTINKIINDIAVIAKEFNLGIYHNGDEILPSSPAGFFNISNGGSLDPAPVSPTNGTNWDIFSGSIKHIIEDYIYPNITEPAVVAANLNTGNTDTSKYWALTNHIYRYRLSTLNGILNGGTHSVNEHTTIENQLYLTAFVYEYIRNVDEYGGDEE